MHTRDLSHVIETDMPVFPGDPDVSVEPHATVDADGYRVSAIELGSHTGTHVDAPSHTQADGRAIDDVDVDRFAFDAVLADCTGLGPREAIQRDALPRPTRTCSSSTPAGANTGERTCISTTRSCRPARPRSASKGIRRRYRRAQRGSDADRPFG